MSVEDDLGQVLYALILFGESQPTPSGSPLSFRVFAGNGDAARQAKHEYGDRQARDHRNSDGSTYRMSVLVKVMQGIIVLHGKKKI
jgi:hypothetical protein